MDCTAQLICTFSRMQKTGFLVTWLNRRIVILCSFFLETKSMWMLIIVDAIQMSTRNIIFLNRNRQIYPIINILRSLTCSTSALRITMIMVKSQKQREIQSHNNITHTNICKIMVLIMILTDKKSQIMQGVRKE